MRRRMLLLVLAGIGVMGLGYVLYVGAENVLPPSGKPAFSGESKGLTHTQIVATLDTPMEKGRNVIWCASFQAAWKELQTKLAKGPVELQGGPAVAAALNGAYTPGPELPAKALYATAGWEDKGIIEQIRKEVAAQFPGAPTPTFPGIGRGSFVAYSRLEARAKFTIPYFQNSKPLQFTASDGTKTEVTSFGLPPDKAYAYEQLHNQPRVLYSNWAEAHLDPKRPREYVIDLDAGSGPSQVIVAMIAPKETLAQSLDSLEAKIAARASAAGALGSSGVMLVPDVIWSVTHHFAELEGRGFRNPGLKGQSMDVAQEDIAFRLDRYGAEVQAESKMYMKGMSMPYYFNRPFLILMRKRDEAKPYFVMWVDNGELLTRQ